MPIRYTTPDGGTWEFDRIEDAVEWHRSLVGQKSARRPSARNGAEPAGSNHRESGDATREQQPRLPDPRRIQPTPQRGLRAFVSALNSNGRAIMHVLVAAHPEELTAEALAAKSGIPAPKSGPVFRHIYKVGDDFGVTKDELVVRTEHLGTDGRYRSRYRLADVKAVELKEAFEEVAK